MSDAESEEDPRFRIPRGSSDEEIDSDIASISSDDNPPRSPARPNETKTDSDEEASLSEDEDAGGLLLSEMLSSTPQVNPKTVSETAKKLMPIHSDDESDDSLEDILDADEEASDADEEKIAEVVFAATKRRDLDKRRIREARVVDPIVGEESIHAAPGDEDISQKDMMQRMLRALGKSGDGDKGPAIVELEKKVARLHTHGKKELPVPLSAPVQGRIERAAAYDQVTQTVSDKWNDVVKNNRKAKRLVFPLNGKGARIGRNTSDIAGNFQPVNEYEDEIHKILVEAGVASDKQVRHGEEQAIDDLGVSEVTKEEVLERRRQMAKMRSLMFHYEQKMKRIKKIKSKKFRRVMKKDREKLAGMMDSEDEEEALLKAERKRAEERMTLRHKNTSKWVRRQLKRGETKRNLNTRAAIEEQLRLHDELKKKQGVSKDSDDEDDEDGDETEEALQKQLNDIQTDLLEDGTKLKKQKGIMGMRFMQAAQERQRKEALELLKEMKTDGEQYDSEDEVKMKGRQFFNREERFTSMRKDAVLEEREQQGLNENGDHDENDDIDELKRRVEEEYGETGNAIEEGKALPGDTLDDIQGVLRRANRPSGFTSKLNGRLSVDDNPWLRSRSSGKIEEHKESEGLDEEGSDGSRDAHDIDLDESTIKKIQTGLNSPRRDNEGEEPSAIINDNAVSATKASKQTVLKSPKTSEDQSGIGLEVQTHEQERIGLLKLSTKHQEMGTSTKPRHGQTYVTKAPESRGESAATKSTNKNKRKRGRIAGHPETESAKLNDLRPGLGRMGVLNNPWLQKKGFDSRKRSKSRHVNQDEEGEREESKKRRPVEDEAKAIERMKQVAEAFAGAGGAEEEDFMAAKMEEVEAGLPEAKDLQAEVLPGWGKWDGADVKPKKTESAFARAARQRLQEARKTAMKARKDAKLNHVILEQRRIKQAAQLTMAQVPFPFAKREEWEMEVRTPICKELIAGGRFEEVVRPRVSKKVGTVIEPLVQTRAGKQAVFKMRRERAEKRNRGRRGLMR